MTRAFTDPSGATKIFIFVNVTHTAPLREGPRPHPDAPRTAQIQVLSFGLLGDASSTMG